MSTARITGRLVQSYALTVPADPGWAQPDRHKHGAAGGEIDRDDAPAGAGWQPESWTSTAGLAGLPGGNYGDATDTGHRATANHRGDEGRGSAVERTSLTSLDKLNGGDVAGVLWGAGGAANGGLRAEGSAPWMNPGASRRRADGGVVTRAPGFRLGHWHIVVKGEHRQGLHLNRPTLRAIAPKRVTKSTDPSIRTSGPLAPRQRTILQPYTTPAPVVTAPDVIGAGWAM